jgi:hypothetical protein
MGTQARRQMTPVVGACRSGRHRPWPVRPFWRLASALFALLLAAGPLHAQDPPDPQRPPPDTVAAVADTVPPRTFPPLEVPREVGFAAGTWRWDRTALLNETGVSVADLLERVPGLLVVRTGTILQPAGVSAFGAGGRVEVELDGFLLDPLHAAAVDLGEIPLASIAELVVERRLDGVRIRLRSDEPVAQQPYTRVEAGLGLPEANMFRGLFLTPRFLIGPLGAAVDRLDGIGTAGRAGADVFAGWVRWGWNAERHGVLFEHRRHTLRRTGQSPWLERRARSDYILRGRRMLSDDLVAEVFAGHSREERTPATGGGTPDDVIRDGYQAGARAALDTGPLDLLGALRFRTSAELPGVQATVRAALRPGPVGLAFEVDHAVWDAGPATMLSGRASLAPTQELLLFAEAATGRRGAPARPDTVESRPGALLAQRTALRAGAEARLLGATVGGAVVRIDADSIHAFGLPFDSLNRSFPGGVVTGWEASASIPLWQRRITLFGSATTWFDGMPWAYLPEREARGGIQLRFDPLPTGNLEVEGRLSALHRGFTLVPFDPADPAAPLTVAPESTRFIGEIFLRIIDVRIFFRYDDFADAEPALIPGVPPGGARLMYGVKWHFWN